MFRICFRFFTGLGVFWNIVGLWSQLELKDEKTRSYSRTKKSETSFGGVSINTFLGVVQHQRK